MGIEGPECGICRDASVTTVDLDAHGRVENTENLKTACCETFKHQDGILY
jgi:hypothetical protein